MSIRIEGAPAPGWYLPIGEGMEEQAPYYWTGHARVTGDKIDGYTLSIIKDDFAGVGQRGEWSSAQLVREFGDITRYRLVPMLPDTWYGVDIRETARLAGLMVDFFRTVVT